MAGQPTSGRAGSDKFGRPDSVRTRAPRACERCRQRRERCDAAQRGTPCTRCESSGEPNCVIGPSRRGKYSRKEKRTSGLDDTIAISSRIPTSEPIVQNPRPDPQAEAVATQPIVPPSATGNRNSPVALQQLSETTPSHYTPSTAASGITSVVSYRELPWASVFEHFIDSQGLPQDELVDKCTITYLGESFPLSMVLDSFSAEGTQSRLHYAGPRVPDNEDGPQEGGKMPSPLPSPEDMNWLEAKGAFEYPEPKLLETLKSAFVDRFFPVYPIVHLEETLRQLENRSIPWILLHAICFVAAGVCHVTDLNHTGLSRHQIRERFYSKAKALFDVSYEVNKVVLLQTATLMTFSIGRPNEYWNFWTWNATSVTLAETLGLHRSMAASNIPTRDKSLLRRLWWVLVIRDASAATLIGRPFRINSVQCDVEMLSMEDFEYETRSFAMANHPLRDSFGLYQIQMAKLSCTLRQIILSRYSPHRSAANIMDLKQALSIWFDELPPILHEGVHGEIFGRCLSMAYQHHLILVNFPQTLRDSEPERDRLVNDAAQNMLSIAYKVVRDESLLLVPQETFPPMFLAEVVFLKQAKSQDRATATMGRSAMTSCQLLWHTVNEAWDSSPWVMQLFDKAMAQMDRQQQENSARPPNPSNIDGAMLESSIVDPTFGGLYTYLDGSLENGLIPGGVNSWIFPSVDDGFWNSNFS